MSNIPKQEEARLKEMATAITNTIAGQINVMANIVDAPSVTYKAQWILEQVIENLRERV